MHWSKLIEVQSPASGSIPARLALFNRKILLGDRRGDGAEPQSLVSIPNIPE